MELRTLRYLVAIADAGTMTAAAQQLHVSQPALSRQMMDLEDELHTPLFDRSGRGVSLTSAGTYLVNRARQILTMADSTVAALDQQTPLSGPLTIGLGESPLNQPVLSAAAHLVQQYPAVQLRLYSGNADDVFERLDHGLLDFGVVIDPADKNKYAWAPLPGRNVWGLAMPASAPLAKKSGITRQEMPQLPLMISERAAVQQMLENWLGAPLSADQIVTRYNLIYNAALLTKAGVGYAVTLRHLLDPTDRTLVFVSFTPTLTTAMTLIWPKNTPLSPTARAFQQIFSTQKP
ncbi:LysR family transcriptional regulator [Schleiferilactobacillus harbinensis]|uniref:LysR family transcriptional regulator n=1 Tax=Schleiferilactobacillus harbinensis TaxID=304207 RepID=A0A5P8M829_9LACO|nr:LysR family transcriptional regulator [Schleiferilactobacillus harbinensis]QFR24477.1 LysR family transcriptional regulator [Schleiferilactobacillus harbinensis]